MADTEVESTKRGCKGEKELLVEQAIRTSSNVRTRQNKIRDNKFQEIMERIQSEGLDKNKMIIIILNLYFSFIIITKMNLSNLHPLLHN